MDIWDQRIPCGLLYTAAHLAIFLTSIHCIQTYPRSPVCDNEKYSNIEEGHLEDTVTLVENLCGVVAKCVDFRLPDATTGSPLRFIYSCDKNLSKLVSLHSVKEEHTHTRTHTHTHIHTCIHSLFRICSPGVRGRGPPCWEATISWELFLWEISLHSPTG